MKSLCFWCVGMLWGFFCWACGAGTIAHLATLKEKGEQITRGLMASEFFTDFLVIRFVAACFAVACSFDES